MPLVWPATTWHYLGHTEVIFKSDGEAAIKALKEAVKAEAINQIEVTWQPQDSRSSSIIPEESPAYDSAPNGKVEVTVKIIQGQARTLKAALESRLKSEVSDSHDCLPWMVRHAAPAQKSQSCQARWQNCI